MSLMNRSGLNSVRSSIGMGQGNIRNAGTRNKDMANTDNAVSWKNPGMQEQGNSQSPYNFSYSNPFGMQPGQGGQQGQPSQSPYNFSQSNPFGMQPGQTSVQPSPFPSPQPMGNPGKGGQMGSDGTKPLYTGSDPVGGASTPVGGQAGGGGGETGPLTLQQPMPTFSPPRAFGQRGYDAMVAQQQANRPFWMGTRRPATPPAPVKPQVGYDGNIDPPPADNNTSYVQPNFTGGY